MVLAVVVVLVVALLAYGGVRFRGGSSAPGDGGDDGAGRPRRPAPTDRWVAAGLISADQAQAIAAFEGSRSRARPGSQVSPGIEALSYVGGVLLAVGAAMLVGQFWDRIGTGGHLGVTAAAAVAAGVVGAVVGETDPAAWRLRGFLWALSAGGAGAAAGLFVFEVVDRSGEPVAVAAAGTVAVVSVVCWRLRERPLQHALTFVGSAVALAVGIAWAGSGNVAAGIGIALWCLGASWAALAWRRLVPPAVVGFGLGAATTLVASGIVGARFESAAPLLGLATAAAWVVVGILGDEGLALAPGVVGTFVFLPWTLGQFFGESLGAPAVVMLSGALLLAVVVVLLRRRRGSAGGAPAALGRHFRPSASA